MCANIITDIYRSIYVRSYLGVVGSLLRNKDNNCGAVKKVNGREHGTKKEKRTRIHSEKKSLDQKASNKFVDCQNSRAVCCPKTKRKSEKSEKKAKKKIGKLNQQKYLFNSSNNNNMSKGKPRGSQKLKTS